MHFRVQINRISDKPKRASVSSPKIKLQFNASVLTFSSFLQSLNQNFPAKAGPADASFGGTVLNELCSPLFLHRPTDRTIPGPWG